MSAHVRLRRNWLCFASRNILLPLQPGSCLLCEGCVRLWSGCPSSLQICSWFTPGESHAQMQLLFNKWQISLSATFPLPSLSSLRLQVKFNPTQKFLVPPTCLHSVYSHDMQHDHPLFHPASTYFFTQLSFFSPPFRASYPLLSMWHR